MKSGNTGNVSRGMKRFQLTELTYWTDYGRVSVHVKHEAASLFPAVWIGEGFGATGIGQTLDECLEAWKKDFHACEFAQAALARMRDGDDAFLEGYTDLTGAHA